MQCKSSGSPSRSLCAAPGKGKMVDGIKVNTMLDRSRGDSKRDGYGYRVPNCPFGMVYFEAGIPRI